MRLFNNTNIDFVGKSAIAKFLSIALIIIGLASLGIKGGPALSIDFTGGTIAQLQFEREREKRFPVQEVGSTLEIRKHSPDGRVFGTCLA